MRLLGLVVLPIVTIVCAGLAALILVKAAQTCCGITLCANCCHWRRHRSSDTPGDSSDPSGHTSFTSAGLPVAVVRGHDRLSREEITFQSASSNFAGTDARWARAGGDSRGTAVAADTSPRRDTSFWSLYHERYAALQRLQAHSQLHSHRGEVHHELQLVPSPQGRGSTEAGVVERSSASRDHAVLQGFSPWAGVLAGALAAVGAGQRWRPDESTKEAAGEVLATWEDVFYAKQLWKLKVSFTACLLSVSEGTKAKPRQRG